MFSSICLFLTNAAERKQLSVTFQMSVKKKKKVLSCYWIHSLAHTCSVQVMARGTGRSAVHSGASAGCCGCTRWDRCAVKILNVKAKWSFEMTHVFNRQWGTSAVSVNTLLCVCHLLRFQRMEGPFPFCFLWLSWPFSFRDLHKFVSDFHSGHLQHQVLLCPFSVLFLAKLHSYDVQVLPPPNWAWRAMTCCRIWRRQLEHSKDSKLFLPSAKRGGEGQVGRWAQSGVPPPTPIPGGCHLGLGKHLPNMQPCCDILSFLPATEHSILTRILEKSYRRKEFEFYLPATLKYMKGKFWFYTTYFLF